MSRAPGQGVAARSLTPRPAGMLLQGLTLGPVLNLLELAVHVPITEALRGDLENTSAGPGALGVSGILGR